MIRLRLAELLEDRGKTIYWLGKQTGIRFPTLYAWAKETPKQIGTDALEKICKALDCEPADLIVMKVTSKVTERGKR